MAIPVGEITIGPKSGNWIGFKPALCELRRCPKMSPLGGVELEMRTHIRSPRVALLMMCMLSPPVLLQAQQPTYLIPIEMKGQLLRGSVAIARHENDGMIGINGKGTEFGYKVETVTQGLPAAIAGILAGDIIVSVDGTSVKGNDTLEAPKLIANKRDGETVTLAVNRNGEAKTFGVKVGLRKRLLANDAQWQAESKFPPGVMQFIFGGSATIGATMFQSEQYPNDAFLGVYIFSKDASSFAVDAAAAETLARQNGCFKCHSIDKQKDGPPYKEVAAKYKGKADAESRLIVTLR